MVLELMIGKGGDKLALLAPLMTRITRSASFESLCLQNSRIHDDAGVG